MASPPSAGRRLLFAVVPLLLLLGSAEGLARLKTRPGCGRRVELLLQVQRMPPQTIEASMQASAPMPDDALLGWINLPDFVGLSLGAQVRHNHLGLRGPNRPTTKPAGWKRVVVLGDSSIYGQGVSEGQTFSALLESSLKAKRKGGMVEVINAGVPAYSSLQSLHQLQQVLSPFSPDLVVIANLWSDSIPSSIEDSSWMKEGIQAQVEEWIQQTDETISARSALRCLLQRRASEAPGDAQFRKVSQPSDALRFLSPGRRVLPEHYRENLEAMADWARSHGAVPLFLGLGHPQDHASGLQGLDETMTTNIQTYRQSMATAATAAGAPYVDTAGRFGGARDSGEMGLFVDMIHPSARGHEILAGALLEMILGDPSARQALGL